MDEQTANKNPLGWWARIQRGLWGELFPQTELTSSIGVMTLKVAPTFVHVITFFAQEVYGSFKVLSVKFLGSFYNVPNAPITTTGGRMTHVHTTHGKFHPFEN